MFTVIQTIVGTLSDSPETTDVTFYSGEDKAQAISAMAMAIAGDGQDKYYEVVSVRCLFG